MRKYISIICAAIMMVSLLCACGNTASVNSETSGDKLQIVTTIFPEYDWVMSILGENSDAAEVTMLLDNGVDLHSYQPTAEDIMKISTCDVFIYVGGESDEWVDDALKEATNKDMIVIDLLDILADEIKEEEVVEGMEAEDEEGEDGDSEEEEIEYDEHVWLSLSNAEKICNKITEALVSVDPANKDVYDKNFVDYSQKLSDLNEQYKEVVNGASNKTLLFGDRFPFRYMVDDYGLSYYAAFVGCSAETEASFETITFFAGKVDELSLSSIMTIEGKDHKIAETIRDNTKTKDQNILTLDSMQATTSEDVANGTTYLSVMEGNLEVLKEALK